jgi:hypothetical protein
MAKNIDKEFMLRLINEHKKLTTKTERGEFIRRVYKSYGITKDQFYKYRKDNTLIGRQNRSDKGKPRVNKDTETFIRDMKTIAAIKMASSLNHRNDWKFFRNSKFNPTDMAINIALSFGKISQKYSRTTVNNWLSKMGLNFSAVFRELAAIHIEAEHSNHVWLGDATPIQSIYLRDNGKILYDPSLGQDKNHGEDRIRRLKLRKVWMYFVVDKYSGAFVIRFYIGNELGENPQDWLETYAYCMCSSDEKDGRIPMQGIPLNLYGDKGAMNNSMMEKFGYYFGINIDWHLPGNSRASGKVESRISAVKRLYETLWNSAIIDSAEHNTKFDSFCDFMHEWMIETNESKGLYSNYRLGLKFKEEITSKHILQSILEPEIKPVSNYGEIQVDGTTYYVHSDLNGTKVKITRRFPNTVYATDYLGDTHECTTDLKKVVYGKFHSHKKTEIQRNKEDVYEMAKDFKANTSPEDLLPSKILPFRTKNDNIYSVQKAINVLLEKTNTNIENIPDETLDMFKEFFRAALIENIKITPENMETAIQIFTKYQEAQNE